ncbi:MAG: hypothetical protein IIA58_06345 [Candidatus Marinimicrobia bacterium]|nr:hypothetical protein [Candidatus Neomarinimicrobiota bacterium]
MVLISNIRAIRKFKHKKGTVLKAFINTVRGIALISMLTDGAEAQQVNITPLNSPILMQRTTPASPIVQLRFINPGEESDAGSYKTEQSISSGSYRLSGLFPIGENSAIEIAIPYQSHKTTYSFDGGSDSWENESSDLGNISVTYIKGNKNAGSNSANYLSLGVFLPTAGDESWGGILDNYYDFPAFTDEWLAIKGLFSIVTTGSRYVLNVEGGVDSWIHVGDEDEDVEYFGRYGIGYTFLPSEKVSLHGEFVGYGILSEEDIGDGSRFQHQLALGARYQIGKIVPGIFFIKNFNDLGDEVPTGIALEVSMIL